ncbi:hypothetical protein G6F63_014886 [Rhizopus arrhizus]|nr:hypothetical protein G6F63_014886 [Rhizopus arrhizus]
MSVRRDTPTRSERCARVCCTCTTSRVPTVRSTGSATPSPETAPCGGNPPPTVRARSQAVACPAVAAVATIRCARSSSPSSARMYAGRSGWPTPNTPGRQRRWIAMDPTRPCAPSGCNRSSQPDGSRRREQKATKRH